MDFLSNVGNFFHAIGNFVTGGNSNSPSTPVDNQINKRPNQTSPQYIAPTQSSQPSSSPTLSVSSSPSNGNMISLGTPLTKINSNNVNPVTNSNPTTTAPASNLIKVNQPAPAISSGPTAGATPPANNNGGFWHSLTHNGFTNTVGNVAKGIYHDAANAADVGLAAGQGVYGLAKAGVDAATGNQVAEQNAANQANSQMNKSLSSDRGLLTPNEAQNADLFGNAQQRGDLLNPIARGIEEYAPYAVGGGLEKIGSDATTAGVASLMPGATSRYLTATALGMPSDIANEAAGKLFTSGIKYGGAALSGGLINTAFGAGQGLRSGETPLQVLEKTPGNFATGAVIGTAIPGAKDLTSAAIDKIHTPTDVPTALDTPSTPQPNEVGAGLKSANPDQPVVAPTPTPTHGIVGDPTDNEPAYMRAPAKAAAAAQTASDRAALENSVAPQTPLDTVPSYQHQQNIQSIVDNGNMQLNNWANDNPYATPQEVDAMRQQITQQVTDAVNKAQADRTGSMAGQIAKDVITNPATVPEGIVGADLAKTAVEDSTNHPSQPTTPTDTSITDTPTTETSVDSNGNPINPTQVPSTNTPVTTPVTTPIDVSQNINNIPGSTSVAPVEAPIKGGPDQVAPSPTTPLDVQDTTPQAPTTVDTQASTPAPTQEQLTQAAATEQAAQTPGALIADAEKRQAQNAPDIQNALNKEIGSTEPGNTHAVMEKQAMSDLADRTAQSANLEDLVTTHAAQEPTLQTPQDAFNAASMMRRIYQEAPKNDPAATAAMNNLAKSISDYGSRSGQGVNVMADVTDNLPSPVKANIYTKTLTRMWGEDIGDNKSAPAILKTAAGQASVAENLTNLLDTAEASKQAAASTDGQIEAIQNSLKPGEVAPKGTLKEVTNLQKQSDLQAIKSAANNADLVRYYNSLTPSDGRLQNLNNWAKTSMLTSPTGRVNNLFNVGGNSLYEIARSLPESWLNKIASVFKSQSVGSTKSLFNRGLVRGVRQGLRTVGGELRGEAYVKDIKSNFGRSVNQGNYDLVKTVDNKGINKVVNVVNSLVKMPSNILGGAVRDADLYRQGIAEGKAAGYSGSDLKIYAQSRASVPTSQMLLRSQELQDQVSHMNNNPLANIFSGFGKLDTAPGSVKGAVGLIKNTFLAFPKYPATFVWNTLTDRNIVADSFKLAKAAKNGDVGGITKALGSASVNAGGMYIGYHLMQNGTITTKDANGYSDSGMYFHIGDRYIPLGFFGVVSESLLGGAAMYNAVNSNKGNPATAFFQTIGNTMLDTVKNAGAQSLVGAGNKAISTTVDALTGKNNVTAGDAAAAVGGEQAGTYVPSFLTDVNAGLNQTSLNPTHEAALTKVTKGQSGTLTKTGALSTAEDIPRTELNSFINRIPGLSQTMLPRNPAVTSSDLVDRVDRGSHTGVPQQAVLNDQKAALSKVQSDLQNGIPVYDKLPNNNKVVGLPKGYTFNNALNTQIQGGHYDKAITGLQSELSTMNASKTAIPPTTKQAVQDHIKQLQVLKGIGPNNNTALMNAYGTTSVTQWRALATTNPALYQQLYNLDQSLAAAGVSGGNIKTPGSKSTPKYSLSKSATSGSVSSLVKTNTIKSRVQPTHLNFSLTQLGKNLPVNIPHVKITPPDALIKASTHKITVSNPHGSYN